VTKPPATGSLTILNIAAHPDDLDFGCAGTTATLTDAGHRVVYCLVTDGQAGGTDHTISRERMAEIRRVEQTKAAKVVGVDEVHFLGYPDGAVEVTMGLRNDLTRVIRQVKPDRVVTQSPVRQFDRVYGSHPDHLATGEATLSAIYPDSRNEFAHIPLHKEEGLEPHTVPETWLMGGPEANHFVDITHAYERKVEALLCHESQMADPDRIPDLIRTWGERVALVAGLPIGHLAEEFRRMNTQ
jgi:LmbE family N-acetylglucosaminyl deacetylase